MDFFKTRDPERELLFDYYQKKGLSGDALEEAIKAAKDEIALGKPIAYIIEEQAFFDLVFYVNESVLIPRPDTERLVEKAIALLPTGGSFLELGTGSGCIAVTLLKHRRDVKGTSLDLSPSALKVAGENASRVGIADRLSLVEGDMREKSFSDRFDFIISNPPYIPRADIARYPSLAYEPMMALDGGEDGMDFYRVILKEYRGNIQKGGGFLFEIGFDQGDAIKSLGASLGYTCEVYRDFGNNDRVALLYPIEAE